MDTKVVSFLLDYQVKPRFMSPTAGQKKNSIIMFKRMPIKPEVSKKINRIKPKEKELTTTFENSTKPIKLQFRRKFNIDGMKLQKAKVAKDPLTTKSPVIRFFSPNRNRATRALSKPNNFKTEERKKVRLHAREQLKYIFSAEFKMNMLSNPKFTNQRYHNYEK